jgi:formate-dependent nitrite reductase membrane component NrfD
MPEFVVGFKRNTEFGLQVALNLAFEGSGSALVMVSALANYPEGVIAGLVLVGIGILFLLFHLGNRLRFWRVLFGLKNSWISRGAFFAGALVFFSVLFLIIKDGTLGSVMQVGTVIFAALTILYSGFFLASMTPIPFWNTPLTPVLFLLHSMTTGLSVMMFMLVLTLGVPSLSSVLGWGVLMAGLALIFTVIHVMVMSTSTNASRESVRLLVSDGLRLSFLGGTVTVGLVIPLIIFLFLYLNQVQSAQSLIVILAVSMVCRIIGDYAFRSSILNAGVYEMMI